MAFTSQATKKGIPPGARWTKIDRYLVNPQSLEEAKERFEERQDCVIVLRVLTKEEIQKLADRTREIRGNSKPCQCYVYLNTDDFHLAEERYEEVREERRAAANASTTGSSSSRRHERNRDRKERDEYTDDSEDEYQPRAPRMLEAPSSVSGKSAETADFNRENWDRRNDRERDRDTVYSTNGTSSRRDEW